MLKGKLTMSSRMNDDKTELYNDVILCAGVIDRALHSNDIPSIHHKLGALMLILFLSDIDQNTVTNDEFKTRFLRDSTFCSIDL
uniref:Uncharacterized protein n=1 Tax=Romanomermis culicivorax TaxID=13658 RepID=A0A915HPL6_ROMCU